MKTKKGVSKPKADDQPQIYKPESADGKWTFSRRDFLKFVVVTTASAVAASLPGVKDVLGLRVQLVAHSTELTGPNLKPGQSLTKVWYLKNNSDQPWGEGAMLNLISLTAWQVARSIPLPNLTSGQVTPIRVSMIAPADMDPRPIEATIKVNGEAFKIFLPIIHKSPSELPCTCDSYVPCTCHNVGPCSCDYLPPCSCDVYYCACDYLPPCVCDAHYCPCDYLPPCVCDAYVPCSCDSYIPCGCDAYVPCGCVYF